MYRIVPILCVVFCVACSGGGDPNRLGDRSTPEVEDGGTDNNADRERAEAYLVALGEVQSPEEEERLLREFATWLDKKEFTIFVEDKDGKHLLSCPYFPPVTPWTEHSFLDVKNLELLPHQKVTD